jgi:hypothetical protein
MKLIHRGLRTVQNNAYARDILNKLFVVSNTWIIKYNGKEIQKNVVNKQHVYLNSKDSEIQVIIRALHD